MMRRISQWRRAAGAIVCWSMALAAQTESKSKQDQSKLPEGEAKPLVVRMCGKCHGLESVVRKRMTPERWEAVVDDMVSRGAQGTDDEVDQVIDYLVQNFSSEKAAGDEGAAATPKVRINQAAAKELAAALEISAADADAIVRYREKNGSFKEWDQLKKVPGIDLKKLEGQKDRIEY
jgi:competence protein ComEA